jgi:cytoskeletal protein CcmA (bactofilin family)
MFGRSKAPRLSGRIDTLLGRGTVLTGDLEFSGGLHVDGAHHGNVRGLEGSTPATLWVGEPGRIHGNVEVAVAVINGEVIGNVRGSDRVVLGAKARVRGDVSYGVIEMSPASKGDWCRWRLPLPSRAPRYSMFRWVKRLGAIMWSVPLTSDRVGTSMRATKPMKIFLRIR